MQQLTLFAFAACLLLATPFAAEATEPNPVEKPGWKLTFQDEFDDPLLDDMKWYPAYRSGRIDYLRRTGANSLFQSNNAYYGIENGILKLMIGETLPTRKHKIDRCVSCIQTSDHRFGKTKKEYQRLDKFAQKYGWFEIRCKTDPAKGVYTAFWLHQADPTDQEYTPEGRRKQYGDGVVEIDIFEMFGFDCAEGLNKFSVFFAKDPQTKVKMGFDPSKDFHTYALEWKEGELNWYVDNKVLHTYKGDTPQKEMFILLAIFHNRGQDEPGWDEPVDPNLTYPRALEVDYVRAYLPEEKYTAKRQSTGILQTDLPVSRTSQTVTY